MKRNTDFTGALSSASNSIPCDDRPNDATTSSIRSDDACGMAMPKPIPVLIVSSRCLSDARMLSRSSGLILPWATRRSISSTMALQRSVAFISGMICSAVSRLAKDMQDSQWGRKLNVRLSDDKRHLAVTRTRGRQKICRLESAMYQLSSPRSFLAALIFILLAAVEANAEPAMWVVRDADSTIYLIGTMHLLKHDAEWKADKV